MNYAFKVIRLFIGLLILLGAGVVPAQAGAAVSIAGGENPCDTVDFYFRNATSESLLVDIINWSNSTRWASYVAPGESGRFSLAPGDFEFWAMSTDTGWSMTAPDVYIYDGCTRVDVYIKNIKEPEFKIHSRSY